MAALPQLLLLQSWPPAALLPQNWNLPAWTLSIELLFYALFPLFSRIISGLSLRAIWTALAALAALMLVLRTPAAHLAGGPSDWMMWVPLPLLRLPEFLFGILLAALLHRDTGARSPCSAPVLILALAALLASSTSTLVAPLTTLLAGIIIFEVAHGGATPLLRILGSRPLLLLGGASYAIYMLAIPIRLSFDAFGLTSLSELALYPLVLIGVGVLVFRTIEEPARRAINGHYGSRSHVREVGDYQRA